MAQADDGIIPQRSGSFRATVRVGATTTEYLRAGSGRPVLLLRPSPDAGDPWQSLLATIAGSLRVIAPEVMPRAADPAAWFAAFLEGLGLQEVAVVASGEHAALTTELARREPDRISRCVLLVATPPPRTPATIAQPLLVLPEDGPVGDSVAAVVRFLVGDPDEVG